MQPAETITPAAILSSALFTAREKIALLTQLKAEIASAQDHVDPALYPREAIDEAIAALAKEVAHGTGATFVPPEEH
jgi:hypothetical protein